MDPIPDSAARMLRLEHVGIAVADARPLTEVFAVLFGRAPYMHEVVPSESVRTTFFEAGPVKIELLEAMEHDSALGRYLDRSGPGLHHLAFEVADVDDAARRIDDAGFRVLSDPRPGADRKRIFFIHPRDTAGILFECCCSSDEQFPVLQGDGPAGAPAVLVLADPGDTDVARALARRMRVWTRPGADVPEGHHVVAFGRRVPVDMPDAGSPFRIVVIDPPLEWLPHDRADLLVIRRTGHGAHPAPGPDVRIPEGLLRRLPDPATTLADLIAAHLTA